LIKINLYRVVIEISKNSKEKAISFAKQYV
jgi:hypothetical protein